MSESMPAHRALQRHCRFTVSSTAPPWLCTAPRDGALWPPAVGPSTRKQSTRPFDFRASVCASDAAETIGKKRGRCSGALASGSPRADRTSGVASHPPGGPPRRSGSRWPRAAPMHRVRRESRAGCQRQSGGELNASHSGECGTGWLRGGRSQRQRWIHRRLAVRCGRDTSARGSGSSMRRRIGGIDTQAAVY